MKAFLIFQSVARGLEAVSREYLASIGGLGDAYAAWPGADDCKVQSHTRLAVCNTLASKQAGLRQGNQGQRTQTVRDAQE